ncbi:MAG TPA: helix-turn-helix domain-containing protein [Galbitalea sp.]|jgi:excisionase family DNA binding protein
MSALLTVAEAAEKLRKSERFVLDELRRKNLRGSKYGGSWQVSEAAIDVYIAAHQNVSAVQRRSA